MNDPLETLGRWLEEACKARVLSPNAMTLVTSTKDAQPSARVVSLKRLEADALVFTTALWTRKADELQANPRVAAVFHWPSLGRQVEIGGHAEIAERELAEELFAEPRGIISSKRSFRARVNRSKISALYARDSKPCEPRPRVSRFHVPTTGARSASFLKASSSGSKDQIASTTASSMSG